MKQLSQARTIADVVSVQNLFNVTNKQSEGVLEYCEQQNLEFIPWFPMDRLRWRGYCDARR